MSEANEYRLLHKKDGTYVLQVKVILYVADYYSNKMKQVTRWEDIETVEEK